MNVLHVSVSGWSVADRWQSTVGRLIELVTTLVTVVRMRPNPAQPNPRAGCAGRIEGVYAAAATIVLWLTVK